MTMLLLPGMCLPSCSKSNAPAQSAAAPDSNLPATNENSRAIPRRAFPLVVMTNAPAPVQPQATITNTAPIVTCGGSQSFPCTSPDGISATLTAHVEDADGNPLSVTWSIDGRERYAQQVSAAGPPTAADLSFAYTLSAGEHAIKVTVSDGTLSASCDSTMTVQKDAQDPVVTCPRDIVVPTDPGGCSALVTFTARATDNCPDVALACEPPSGTAFPIGTTTVVCTATDMAGNSSDCGFDVVVRFTNRCPQGEGFWRQNPGAWPIGSLTMGGQVYTRGQLVPLLRATAPADASMLLARQLIAACLNTANGSDPRPICGELERAHGVLASFSGKLPYRVNVSSGAGRAMMELTTRLNGYNSGMLTSDCVP
jgi:hypothetical protein